MAWLPSTGEGVAEVFGGRKVKKELEDLRGEHHDLEERYEDLHERHEKLSKEAGEQTNMRISYIEEEIESMNQRVEKLATDSYEIRSEVRDIHESVVAMQTSLSEIVSLYKAIISRYGFGDARVNPAAAPPRKAKPGDEPGDDIIRALKKEDGAGQQRASAREGAAAPRKAQAPPPPPRPVSPSASEALDELHRMSLAQKEGEGDEEDLASRLASRSSGTDRMDRVARRDLGRAATVDRGAEGEFTRSLPRKSVAPKEGRTAPGTGGDWETMRPPEGEERPRRPKPKLHDLLSPE